MDQVKNVPIPSHSFFYDFYNLWGQLSGISSWITIIGFGITIFLLITTAGIKNKVNRSFKLKAFKEDKVGLMNELDAIRILVKRHPNDVQNLFDLSEPLRRLDDFKIYMRKQDKKAYAELTTIIRSGKLDDESSKVIHNLGILVGFLKVRIDFDLNIM